MLEQGGFSVQNDERACDGYGAWQAPSGRRESLVGRGKSRRMDDRRTTRISISKRPSERSNAILTLWNSYM